MNYWNPVEIPPVNANGESDLFMVWLASGRWRPAFYDGGRVLHWQGWRDGQTRERLRDVTHYMKDIETPGPPVFVEGDRVNYHSDPGGPITGGPYRVEKLRFIGEVLSVKVNGLHGFHGSHFYSFCSEGLNNVVTPAPKTETTPGTPTEFSLRFINHEIDGIDVMRPKDKNDLDVERFNNEWLNMPKSDLDEAVRRAVEVGDLPAGILPGGPSVLKITPIDQPQPPEVAPPAPAKTELEEAMEIEMEVNGEDYKPPVGYAVKKFAEGDTVGHQYEDAGEVTGPHQIKLIELAGDGVPMAKLSGLALWVRLDGLKYWGGKG